MNYGKIKEIKHLFANLRAYDCIIKIHANGIYRMNTCDYCAKLQDLDPAFDEIRTICCLPSIIHIEYCKSQFILNVCIAAEDYERCKKVIEELTFANKTIVTKEEN